jgi:hypothetical protein
MPDTASGPGTRRVTLQRMTDWATISIPRGRGGTGPPVATLACARAATGHAPAAQAGGGRPWSGRGIR